MSSIASTDLPKFRLHIYVSRIMQVFIVFANQYIELTKLSEVNGFVSNKQGKAQTVWCKLFTSGLRLFTILFNPKGGGGGPKVPAGQEIACHFSQDHAMVTKILDFIHKHLN